MFKSTIVTLILLISVNFLSAQDSIFHRKPFDFEASYTGENFNNLTGGIKRGSSYLGMVNVSFGFDTEKARFWKGGNFFVSAANTHGATPSGDLTGDFQVASNIEAGNYTFLQELWYKHSFGAFEITAGLQDMNVDFVTSEYGNYFNNSSFGIIPTISVNIPAPIFPLTTLGASVKWKISDRLTWLGAVFDGCPTDFEDQNPYNLRWKFDSADGVLAVTEVQLTSPEDKLPYTHKLGFFLHNSHLVVDENGADSVYQNNHGFYYIADQTIWQSDSSNRKIGAFLQLGLTPKAFNFNNHYVGVGVNYFGLFKKNGEDALGLAVAYARIESYAGNETTIELTYHFPITPRIYIQPDFQYIINPGGLEHHLDNSLAFALRFGLSF